MLVFYIRHGDPIYDPDQLTPLGMQQAEAVAGRLALYGIDEIYSSTSNRALQTAQPLCEMLGKEAKMLDFLHEGSLHGLMTMSEQYGHDDWIWAHPVYSEILCSREVRDLGEKWYTHPKIEPLHPERIILPIYDKIDEFFASLGYEHDTERGLYKVRERKVEKRIAIFAHECMGKVFMSRVLDIPFAQYATHFEMHTSAFSVIRFDDGVFSSGVKVTAQYARARLLCLSNDSHLYREELGLNHRFTHLRELY